MPINSTSAQILVTSASKIANNAFSTGSLNMNPLALYHLISYYANYTKGLEQFNQEHEFLLNTLTCIKNAYINDICNYKTALTKTTNIIPNTAPTANNEVVDILDLDLYQFKLTDFLNEYADAESHPYKFLRIYPDALTEGYLYRIGGDGQTIFPITQPIELDVEFLNNGFTRENKINLFYNRNTDTIFSNDIFRFRVSDNPSNYLFSPYYSMTINASLNVDGFNNLPIIGDNTLYAANRVETILTLDMFTTDTTAPYSDIEGDELAEIRIDEISLENVGIFTLSNVQISEGDVITRQQLINQEFKHIGPNQDTVSSDVFYFSARSENSTIWVQ